MKPVVLIYSAFYGEENLKEVCAGIEEEGVPFEILKLAGDYGAFDLSKKAAESSILEVGIGIDEESVCLYCTALKTETPLFEVSINDKKALRIIGTNSARYVKKMPFKLIV